MRAEKLQLARDIQALIGRAPSIFLVSYKGLTVASFDTLRAALNPLGAACHVVPNRVFRIAAREAGLDDLAAFDLEGDTALICGGEDVVAVAKALRDFSKGHEQMAVKIALVEGRLAQPEQARALADVPSREVLLAQLLGLLQAPAGQLVRVLQASVANIVYVLSAYRQKKEDEQ